MDTIVYVDGFNLYHGSLAGRPGVRWLDLMALSRRLLPRNNIVGIAYCTADLLELPNRPGQRQRQRLYLKALETIPCLDIYKGQFKRRTRRRPLVSPQPGQTAAWPKVASFHDFEEKGSDVNLATRLLTDGFNGRYEAAAVISNDGDLRMPVQDVRCDLRLHVTIINPYKNRVHALSPDPLPPRASYIRLRQSDLLASQFPSPLRLASGATIRKPPGW